MSDHVERWCHRVHVVLAWLSFWRALSWRRRNGLWVCWASLGDEEKREIFKSRVVTGFFNAWHAAHGKRHVLDPEMSVTLDALGETTDDAVPDVLPDEANELERPTRHWDRQRREYVHAPDVDAFLERIVGVCESHGMSLGHEDRQGAFEIYRSVEPEAIRWMMAAHIVDRFDNDLDNWSPPLLLTNGRLWPN